MINRLRLTWLLTFIPIIFLAAMAQADPTDGERLLTPNQQRRVAQMNQNLPKDLIDQAGDSRKVARLRKELRKTLTAYQKTVKEYGNGKPQTRTAAHLVMDTQDSLHKQFIQEEATPVIASR